MSSPDAPTIEELAEQARKAYVEFLRVVARSTKPSDPQAAESDAALLEDSLQGDLEAFCGAFLGDPPDYPEPVRKELHAAAMEFYRAACKVDHERRSQAAHSQVEESAAPPRAEAISASLSAPDTPPDPRLNACRVSDLNPSLIVGRYDPAAPRIPIAEDAEIAAALRSGQPLLVRGRRGSGKSRAVLHHLQQQHPNAWLLRPSSSDLVDLPAYSLPTGQLVLLLDDLEHYLQAASSSGTSVFELIADFQGRVPSLIVVSTIRDTDDRLRWLRADLKLVIHWHAIALRNWTTDQARALVGPEGDFRHFVGTPFSAKHPPEEIRLLYRLAEPTSKMLLRALLFFRIIGVVPVPRDLLHALYTAWVPEGPGFDEVLDGIGGQDLLKECGEKVEAYDPYLDVIDDWRPSDADRRLVQGILIRGNRVPQLLVLASETGNASSQTGEACSGRMRPSGGHSIGGAWTRQCGRSCPQLSARLCLCKMDYWLAVASGIRYISGYLISYNMPQFPCSWSNG